MRPITRSASPWIEVRSLAESASVSSALAATKARFQPTPLRNNPSMTSPLSLPGAMPATATASSSPTAPATIIGTRPKRSQSQPDSGEATYMPPRCIETARPMVPTEWPWSCR